MRYVLINELYVFGGAEIQSLREKDNMEKHGHIVLYITFAPDYPDGWDEKNNMHYNFRLSYSRIKDKIYNYITDRKLLRDLKLLVDNFNPDFIHINNVIKSAYVVYRLCDNYMTLKTVRDYGFLCPLGTCVDKNLNLCTGAKFNNCIKKCMPSINRRRHITNYFKYYKRSIYEKKYVNFFVSPSQLLTDYCNSSDYETYCLNNPFDFSIYDIVPRKEKSGLIRHFIYYGLISEHKGIFEFLDAFLTFSNNKDVKLEIAGKIEEKCQEKFAQYLENKKIIYHGSLPYLEVIKLLSEMDCVVVPSLWLENYPNTVLEGLSYGCIVLASNRGGMKEMIRDEQLIFDVLDEKDIINKLEYVYELNENERKCKIERNLKFVFYNNSLQRYYELFMKMLDERFSIRGNK